MPSRESMTALPTRSAALATSRHLRFPYLPFSFDICNAFSSIAHVWLFAVLKCFKWSNKLINIILHMYTNCSAYSCGVGTGELLFHVLAGVRTGCPLSANLFLLGFNPLVFLIFFLSDGPKVSRTCICADDVGSCLRRLRVLKVQYSIWKLAANVAGLVLKPSKCFIVVTCIPLTPIVKQAIAEWLKNEIPEWKDMQIVAQGKYLGVFLGVGGTERTFAACEDKYINRCFDISNSVATALPSIVRYNQVAVPVFSYVSQVIVHPDVPRLKRLDQREIHKALKMLPNCMNQALSHNFGEFCPLSPKPIYSLCIAAHSRFAKAEGPALAKMHGEAIALLGDSALASSLVTNFLPQGNIGDRPLIESLLDSSRHLGIYSQYAQPVQAASMTIGRSPRWSQAWFYSIYSKAEIAENMQYELGSKILITFNNDIAYKLIFPGSWYEVLSTVPKAM